MEKKVLYNYRLIFKSLVQYLPAKVIVILNSFLIIPLLTYFLDVREVSIYVISLQILNILCTCSSDWISKALLRFYEKYSIINEQDTFMSTLFQLSLFVYLLLCVILFIFHESIEKNFAVTSAVLCLIGFLLIPCAVRQNLYQILRIKNKYDLYTVSIIIYQLIFIVLFVSIAGILPNAYGIVFAMITAMTVINIYIIKSLPFKHNLLKKIDFNILKEILKYGLPLILTNACYWFILNIPKFIFQTKKMYIESSVLGLGWTIVANVIEPIAGLFIFVNFPILVKYFEHNKNIKLYFTNIFQLYFYIILPLVFCLCFYSQNIVEIILPDTYKFVGLVLPVFAFIIFFHQLLKLINIKYHLKNKTYIETILSLCITLITTIVIFCLIEIYSIKTAIYIMLIAEVVSFIINILIKLKNVDYLNYGKLLKTSLSLICICIISYRLTNLIFYFDNIAAMLLKFILYFVMCYFSGYCLRKYILN